jgi:drug/metabolite transporter (DMT)-like permease
MTAQTMPRADDRAALAALVLGALVIGAAPILVRLCACGPAAAGFWRLTFATPMLLVMSFSGAGGGVGKPSRPMVLAGVFFALDLGCWHYGIRYTSVANATVLPNLTPVLVTLVSWVLFKERPRTAFLLGLAAAVGGAILMAEAGRVTTPGPLAHLGDALSFSTAIWYGLYFLAVRNARLGAATSRVMLWSSLVGAPLLLAAALALGEPILPATSLGWAAAAGLGLAHVAGQGSIAWALGRLPAARASLVVLVQPVMAAGLAYWLFGETLTPLQTAGAVVALLGVVIAQRGAAAAPERFGLTGNRSARETTQTR